MRPERVREPMFNAPWPALALAVVIVLSYLVQMQVPDQKALVSHFGLVPQQLAAGDLIGLVGYNFLHGGWAHVLGNAAWIFVTATPLARLLGETAPRALALFAFFLICGVAAGAIYAGVFELARHGGVPFYHPDDEVVVVGASGAASGLLGAAARTIGQGGRLGPLSTGPVIGLAISFTLVNLMVGVLGFAPGVGPGVLVAWPVHIFGFYIGLFLIGPWVALFGQRPPVELADGWPVPLNEH